MASAIDALTLKYIETARDETEKLGFILEKDHNGKMIVVKMPAVFDTQLLVNYHTYLQPIFDGDTQPFKSILDFCPVIKGCIQKFRLTLLREIDKSLDKDVKANLKNTSFAAEKVLFLLDRLCYLVVEKPAQDNLLKNLEQKYDKVPAATFQEACLYRLIQASNRTLFKEEDFPFKESIRFEADDNAKTSNLAITSQHRSEEPTTLQNILIVTEDLEGDFPTKPMAIVPLTQTVDETKLPIGKSDIYIKVPEDVEKRFRESIIRQMYSFYRLQTALKVLLKEAALYTALSTINGQKVKDSDLCYLLLLHVLSSATSEGILKKSFFQMAINLDMNIAWNEKGYQLPNPWINAYIPTEQTTQVSKILRLFYHEWDPGICDNRFYDDPEFYRSRRLARRISEQQSLVASTPKTIRKVERPSIVLVNELPEPPHPKITKQLTPILKQEIVESDEQPLTLEEKAVIQRMRALSKTTKPHIDLMAPLNPQAQPFVPTPNEMVVVERKVKKGKNKNNLIISSNASHRN